MDNDKRNIPITITMTQNNVVVVIIFSIKYLKSQFTLYLINIFIYNMFNLLVYYSSNYFKIIKSSKLIFLLYCLFIQS